MIPPPPRSTLFPYTTLFRSLHLFKTRQQGRPPRGRTLGSRRQIARLASSRITKTRSEEHTSELQSRPHLVCRLLLEKKKKNQHLKPARTHPHRRQISPNVQS